MSRSASHTRSAASSVQPPRKIESARTAAAPPPRAGRSDQAIVARSVAWRGIGVAAAASRSSRCPSRSSSCARREDAVRAAASSIASGRSSRRSQSSSTASSGSNDGPTARAEELRTAPRLARASTGTGYFSSPATRSRSRLVTSMERFGQRLDERARAPARRRRRARSCRAASSSSRVADRARERPVLRAERAARPWEDVRRIAQRRERHPEDTVP